MTQTIDIGRIAPRGLGEWDSATAYKKLDVVYYAGSSYMAREDHTNIPPNINPVVWQKIAGGSDLAATMSTQGDLLYYDGTNLNSLGIGTDGQLLTANSSTGLPEWADSPPSGSKVRLHRHRWTSSQAVSAGGTMLSGSYFTIVPASPNSHFHITYDHMMNHTYGQNTWLWVDLNDGAGWRELSVTTPRANNYAFYSISYSTITKTDVCKLDDLGATPAVLSTGITFGIMAAGHSNGGTSNYQTGAFSSGYSFVETWEE